MSTQSDLIFTVDSKYYIKATLKSLPHLAYGLDSTKLKYSNEIVQKDFAKWRTGDYEYEELPKKKSIIIKEAERIYTFVEIDSLSPPEMLWAIFDELKTISERLDYSEQPRESDILKTDPLVHADLREELDKVLEVVSTAEMFKKEDVLDEFQPIEFKDLNALEIQIAKLVNGFRYADTRINKFAKLTQDVAAKLSKTTSGIDRILGLVSSFNNINSGNPAGLKFTRPIKDMDIEEKVSTIIEYYNAILDQYEYSIKFIKLQQESDNKSHRSELDMMIAMKNAELNNLKGSVELANRSCREMCDIWKETCIALDKVNKEKESLGQKFSELQTEHNSLKTEIFEKSKNATEFDTVALDYVVSTIKPNLKELNEELTKHATGFVVGIRGYWYGGQQLSFNVVQLICNRSKPFAPFIDLKVINPHVPVVDERAHLTAHDMLNSLVNLSLRLYYNELHVLSIDENIFVSQSISKYLDQCSTKLKDELTKELKNTSDFEVAEISYKTNIQLDINDKNRCDNLNEIIQTRKMKIIGGDGLWLSPVVFQITKLSMAPLIEEFSEKLKEDDEFEQVILPDDKKEDPVTPTPIQLKSIEKYMRKTTNDPKCVVIAASNSSNVNYNTHLLLKY